MNHNFVYQDVSNALPGLMDDVLRHGDEVGSRQGSRTMEMTHVGTTLVKPWRREMLVPERKVNLAAQIAETMWVLSGRNDVEFLSHYLPRAEQFSDDGQVWRGGYGPRLRSWATGETEHISCDTSGCTIQSVTVDQLAEVVDLLRKDPTTRRAVMSIFDPGADFVDSKDIPCNNWITFSNRLGKLDMHVGIRSNDLMWGWSGINAFEWSALQEIVAGMVGVGVGKLHFSTTSLHLYEQHWEKGGKIAASRGSHGLGFEDSPRFNPTGVDDTEALDNMFDQWFDAEYLIRTGGSMADRLVEEFPEPMLQSWLRVLQWWWRADEGLLSPLAGTRLGLAATLAVQPPKRTALATAGVIPAGSLTINDLVVADPPTPFVGDAARLHAEKHAAYGDSWKRRGEQMAIMANIARKVDRLGGSETADETSADTAMDLMIYLAKYRWWLWDDDQAQLPTGRALHYDREAERVKDLLEKIERMSPPVPYTQEAVEAGLKTSFDNLVRLVGERDARKVVQADAMLIDAFRLARHLHWKAGNATRVWSPES